MVFSIVIDFIQNLLVNVYPLQMVIYIARHSKWVEQINPCPA